MARSKSDSAFIADEKIPEYRPPVMTHTRRADIVKAARAHVNANPNRSDPFAYNRIVTYMTRGLELPSEVLADATRLATPQPTTDA